jgi:hypothetical protein
MKRCPFGCGRKILPYWFACSACWYALPKEERRTAYYRDFDYRTGRIARDEYDWFLEQVTASRSG